MFKYECYKHGQSGFGGQQYLFKFENNYGASVVSGFGSYTNGDNPYELAVIQFIDDDKYNLDYSTPITDDVIGYQTVDGINELLDKIKAL